MIAPGDGWASWSGPTYPERVQRLAEPVTGGSAADPAQVYVVDDWQELRDALAGVPGGSQNDARYNQVPRIVYVTGTLDPWLRPDGTRLTCDDIASQVTVAGSGAPFDMDDYIAAFGPGVDPSGPLEQARVEAAALQAKLTLQHIGSNVTLVGVGDDARVVGASLRIRDAHNVIVRNLTLSDAYDCFPQWDAGDSGGNWNSAYDNLSVWTSTSVWVDHNTFDDGDHPATSLDTVYGRPFEVHDGLLDVTHGSDLVTMSWNWFQHHDKTDIIGSSDSRTQDRGQHRVTQHHNRWTDIGQRAPRVRFGDVHVYNNLYEQTDATTAASSPGSPFFQYFWGAGRESSIVAESNAVELARSVERLAHHRRMGRNGAPRERHARERRADRRAGGLQRDGRDPALPRRPVEPRRRLPLRARRRRRRGGDRPRGRGCRHPVVRIARGDRRTRSLRRLGRQRPRHRAARRGLPHHSPTSGGGRTRPS